MSGVIDKNIVQMVFDATQFNKNAQETLSTLDKLKNALNFEGAVRGLENLGSNVRNVGMDGLYTGVYKVQEGFNALDVIATRVLQNITDKIQSVATNLVEKVTVEPLKAGLQEYETQINSVQTILANTNDALIEQGLTTEHDRIEKINGVLDDLNKYADMTIYNFTEMTRNIGTFTAAGVDLDKAATSIKGIANLAAMSGSNSQQASTAMYQLSQAIAAGSVKLQDWNSVVNAGMGGKLFQNELIDTAKAMGVADEQFIALTEGATTFRESLSSGWISADVLTNTLEKFTAGSEGYTRSQIEQMRQLWKARGYSEEQIESLVGSINQLTEEQEANLRAKWAEKGFSDEQIDHILSMGSAATDAATKVKTFTQLLDTLGEALQSGWTQSWEYIIGDFEQAKMLWTEISDIMNTYIGKSADARNAVLEQWSKAAYSYNEAGQLIRVADGEIVEGGKMVAEEMGGREAVIQGLRNAFQGLFEIALQFGQAWDNNFWGKNPDDDISNISITGEKLIELSHRFHDFTQSFKDSMTGPDGPTELLKQLRESFDFFATSMRRGFDGLRNVFSGIGNAFSAFFHSSFFSLDSLNSFLTVISDITGRIRDFGSAIAKHFGPDKDFKNLNGLVDFFNGIQAVLDTAFWTKLDFISNAFEALGDVIDHLISPFGTASQLLGKIGEKLTEFANAFSAMVNNEDVSKFETFFHSLAEEFNGFIDVLRANIDFSGFSKLFSSITEVMTSDKIEPFKIFENVFGGLIDLFKSFIGIASSIAAAFANVFGTDYIFNFVQFVRDLTDRFKSLTESLIPTGDTLKSLQHVFEGIFNILKAVADVVMNLVISAIDSLGTIFKKVLPQGESLNSTLMMLGDKFNGVAKVIESLVTGDNGALKLSDIMGTLAEKIGNLFNVLKNINILEAFSNVLEKIGKGIKHALGGTEDMSLLDTVIEKLKQFLTNLKEVFSDSNGELDFDKIFEAGGIGYLLKRLFDAFKNTKDLSDKFKNISKILTDFKDTIADVIGDLTSKFKAEAVKALAVSMIEIAGALFIIASIDSAALATAVATMGIMFQSLERLLVIIQSFDPKTAVNLTAAASAMKAVGESVLMLAGAIKILGEMDLGALAQGLIAVTILMVELVKVAENLSGKNDMMKGVGGIIALAVALDLLIIPVKTLGGMDFGALVQGLIATTALMAGLTAAAIELSKHGSKFKASTAAGLILMAEAINILANAIVKMQDVPWPDVLKGLTVLTVGLGELVIAADIISKKNLKDELLAVGAGLMMLGASMALLTASAIGLQGIEWETLGKMAAILGGALVALGVATKLLNGAEMMMISSSILMVAQAIALLVAALTAAQVLGPIAVGIGNAFSGMGSALSDFANNMATKAFLDFLQNAILFLPRLAIALAQALIEMVVALGNGAAQIVGAVTNLGSAVITGLRELVPQVFALLKETLDQIIALIIEETPRVFEALRVFFEQLWPFLSEQIHGVFTVIGTFFTELFTFLQEKGPMLVETVRLIIDTVLKAIQKEAPQIGNTIITILRTVLDIINKTVPEITRTLLNLLTSLLKQLAEYTPQMAKAAMEIIKGFLDAIAQNIGSIVESAATIAIEFMKGLTDKLPDIVDTAFKLIISFIEGLASAIEKNHNELFDAIGHLIKAVIEAILDGIGKIAEAAGKWITGEDGNGGILGAIGGFFQDIFNAGANLVQGFINGLLSMPGELWNAACSLATDAWNAITGTLDEHSPSRLTYGGGKNFTLGFINGIVDYSDGAITASGNMASGVLDAFDSALANATGEYTPVIVPVVDGGNITDVLNEIANDHKETSISLSTNLSNDFNTGVHDLGERISVVDSNINSIATALEDIKHETTQVQYKQDELYERLDYYLDSFYWDLIEIVGAQLKGTNIYMDTGSLVGAIAPEMDDALGYRQILSERGA